MKKMKTYEELYKKWMFEKMTESNRVVFEHDGNFYGFNDFELAIKHVVNMKIKQKDKNDLLEIVFKEFNK